MNIPITDFKSEFLKQAAARGFLYQGTNLEDLDKQLKNTTVIAYTGFDATATSLHVGNLVQIMRLRLLQKCGHKPIILMGDGTTRIGDPSGKDTQRQLLSSQQIDQNIESIEKIFSKYLDFNNGPTGAIIVRNYNWLKDLNYLEFLRDYGSYFSVNRMLSFESVKARLDRDQPLSFLEFNYMILQAYDFLELNRKYNCTLQMGGSDQWGNILNGADLIKRIEKKDAYALTTTLITTSDGKKMGKTAQGAVWLNSDMLSPFNYWQFWRNTPDLDVGRFLRIYTDLPLQQIEDLEKLEGSQLNDAKIILADEATRLCHGEAAVLDVRNAAKKLFSIGHNLDDLADTLPTVSYSYENIDQGINIIDVLVETTLTSSRSEARRSIRSNAIRVNDAIINDESYLITLKDVLNDNNLIKISVGKKNHALIKVC